MKIGYRDLRENGATFSYEGGTLSELQQKFREHGLHILTSPNAMNPEVKAMVGDQHDITKVIAELGATKID